MLEIEVEEDVYFLSLWWEFRPVVRKKQMVCSEAFGRKSDEVRGDVVSHPRLHGGRVGKREARDSRR